jgi:hypothetical protein
VSAPAAAIESGFDAFLSYHSTERDLVREIAEALVARDLNVWWDEWYLPPGHSFQQKIDDGLRNCRATVVFIGLTGLGEWQKKEIEAALVIGGRTRHPVIPVFFPGALGTVEVPVFLQTQGAVIFNEALTEKVPMDRLLWGITGVNPNAPRRRQAVAATAVQADPVGEAVKDLADWIRQEAGGVTFFLGGAASGESSQTPPRGYEITRELLKALDLEPGDDALLPPTDFAASYFAVAKDEAVLERRVVGMIQDRSSAVPRAHARLAQLIPRIRAIPPPRGRRAFKHLLFTTNLDQMAERALIAAGIEFTRIVQHRSEKRVWVTEYRDIPAAGDREAYLQSRATVVHESDRLPVDSLKDPLLYKFLGSEDIPSSPVLTSAQYYNFARAVVQSRIVPESIESILSNTRLVFLGCGLFDPDICLLQHTVLSEPLRSPHSKYLVQPPPEQEPGDPNRQLEARIWSKIKEKAAGQRIKTIEASGTEFLDRLREKL